MKAEAVVLALIVATTATVPSWGQAAADHRGRAAAAVGSLLDQIMADQERRRTTPITHRKVGLRPEAGTHVITKPGEVIVARVDYEAYYLARPKEDFVNTRGGQVRADDVRAVWMLNNKFCMIGGGHCFDDKDRDGDWDGAAQERGRWQDVPYIMTELRRELEGGSRRELLFMGTTTDGKPLVRYREFFGGAPVTQEDCAAGDDSVVRCHQMAVRPLVKGEETTMFEILGQ